MFCNVCGSAMTVEQSVCSACGSSALGARAASAARTRVFEHTHLMGILWMVCGALWLIPSFVLAALAGFITIPMAHQGADRIAMIAAPGFLGLLASLVFIGAALRFITGWGLLKMRPWGRTCALVMAFLALLHPPFDTALGIYTLFVLLPDAAGDEYRKMSARMSGYSVAVRPAGV